MRCRSALSCAVSRRFLVLSAPLALQAALAIWHTTLFNMLMAEFNAEQVAGCADQASAPPLALAPAGPDPPRLFRWSK